MREIKYRVFFENKWNYFVIGQSMTEFQQAVYNQCCLLGLPFYQFTGEKDNHSNEIYEDETIQTFCYGRINIHKVEFTRAGFKAGGYHLDSIYFKGAGQDFKVIN